MGIAVKYPSQAREFNKILVPGFFWIDVCFCRDNYQSQRAEPPCAVRRAFFGCFSGASSNLIQGPEVLEDELVDNFREFSKRLPGNGTHHIGSVESCQ